MQKKSLIIGLLSILLTISFSVKAQGPVAGPIYEYWNSTTHKHFYTTDINELGPNGGNGWAAAGTIGDIYVNETIGDIHSVIYRFYQPSSGAHYYTTNQSVYPDGFHFESIIGVSNITPLLIGGHIPVYEYFNSSSGDYYYSTNASTPGGYKLNGIAFYVF